MIEVNIERDPREAPSLRAEFPFQPLNVRMTIGEAVYCAMVLQACIDGIGQVSLIDTAGKIPQ